VVELFVLNSTMKNNFLFTVFLLMTLSNFVFSQTKVSGIVVDKSDQPVPFANIAFKDSNEGAVANEDGRFYIESTKTYVTLVVTSVGFSDREIALGKAVSYNFKVLMKEAESLNEV
jgi:hypothetical protein